ncbi:DoxX family membrane protein [Flavobacterium capsici]|uniref:DoxX family membrane protein n=1 Tax=Flavobacterium capsici TaxID=3075618 RepID=A0AA96F409_9FLAO|nr:MULTISPECIES: DoxX family membrane protein [unclassified Flavobacterium]WNM19637.1 DoxX family membrane protein [Flavobacterium sp. PMR2A8]WNM21026.1 DoxX family membrane protein [Flavobacterium sp. PMTSA4]
MNNPASLLILIFLAITFIQSAYDKIFDWNGNVEWLKGHFSKTSLLKNYVPLSLTIVLLLELITGILTLVGCAELLINGGRTFGFYGAVFSSITLILLLFGQRLAKDYDGARTIAIYFIPSVLAVYWLN